MAANLPLFAQLSHAYTSFTVACDNAFELRVPHRTTEHGGTPAAPWLVSSSLWFRFLRHVPAEGSISIRDLKQDAALPKNEFRMWLTRFESWWGYLQIDPVNKTVGATKGGKLALDAWPALLQNTEVAWRTRFGSTLGDSLAACVAILEAAEPLPPCLSTLNYGLFSTPVEQPAPLPAAAPCDTTLPAMLARLLYAFALDYERETFLSLALCANILRVIPLNGVPTKDLPHLSGIAKEPITNAAKLLLKSRTIEPCVMPAYLGRALRRTTQGQDVHARYELAIQTVQAQWRKKLGSVLLEQLRRSLPHEDELLAFSQPIPGNWRAEIPKPLHLPCFPMILHRGGFPDGS